MENLYPKRELAFGLSSTQLKIIAMALMLVDHIGAFLLTPQDTMYPICRAVGRLAFPIFCFMIAEGARHTRSMPKYMARLAAFALISTPPYNLVHGSDWYSLKVMNIFFPLLLGLAAIFCIQNVAPWILKSAGKDRFAGSKPACALLGLPFCIMLYIAAYTLNTDYGGYGVTAILIFWLLWERPLAAWGIFALLTFIFYDFSLVKYGESSIPDYAMMNPYDMISHRIWEGGYKVVFVNARQVAAPLAAIPCAFYNGQKGCILSSKSGYEKYIFYAFYPLHLMIIWGVQLCMR